MIDSPPISTPRTRGLSFTALALAVLSLLSAIIFAVTSAGPLPLIIGTTSGLAALIIGIIALKKRQPKAPAIFGIVVGALVLFFGLALFIFALLFVGALTFGNV